MSEPVTYIDKYGYRRFKSSKKLVHRWVAEKKILGRRLEKDEIVHHINGNKLDNSESNLTVISKDTHFKLHVLPAIKARAEVEIKERLEPIIEAEVIERLEPIHETKTLQMVLLSFAIIGTTFLVTGIILSLISGRVSTMPTWLVGMPFLIVSLGGWLSLRGERGNES
ncbi:HNH endonuclease [Chloroflexota bacterium]